MSSSSHTEVSPPSIDKGKRRAADAEPSERTPLLGERSTTLLDDPAPAVAQRRLRSKLKCVFWTSLVATVVSLVAAGLLAWSYASRASHISTDDIMDQGLVVRGPDRVDVLSVSPTGGIRLRVQGRMGFDAGAVMGVNAQSSDSLLGDIWKALGRWGVRTLDHVAVNMSSITLTAASDPTIVLATIVPAPVVVPLTANPPADLSWLTPISTTVLIRPTTNATALVKFVREAWRDGFAAIRAEIGSVDVRGGAFGENSWRRLLHKQLSEVKTSLRIEIPPIPGLPPHGLPDLAQLVTLQSFSLRSTEQGALELAALATLPDPAPPSFALSAPSLPFKICLPSSNPGGVHIASVTTSPFSLTHPNISLALSGSVAPLPADATPVLSTFISRYLSGRNNPILVSTPLIDNLAIDLDFPAPNPPPNVLRNVTIRDMSMKPSGTAVTASGTISARVVLPKGMDIKLHVGRVFADVLVFDGPVPDGAEFPSDLRAGKHNYEHDPEDDEDEHPLPPAPPLPDPLPAHAFARIRPDAWVPALSGPVDSEPQPESEGDSRSEEGSVYAISARLTDVPLEVLPGRQKEFSGFISKVVFGTGEGAMAGLLGIGAVGVEVTGLQLSTKLRGDTDHEMELTGLPFRGSVLVGKKGLRHGGMFGLESGVERTKEEVRKVKEVLEGMWPWRRRAL
ncbi:hypothetical protein MKEN_00298600 [Mycena kentingensis (nom. inval.)]|nr:hypothetical protein MKEN_00298600 [Mycena kentingensis (nom. inval.)]